MSDTASAATRLVALLGDPVSHSLSPLLQNAAFRTAGLDAVYLALRCDASLFPGLLRGIVAAGGAGNVTLPHKTLAAQVVDRLTPAARHTGACNTFWATDGETWGDNTDVDGVRRAARQLLGSDLSDARVLLLGAGGAGRAAVVALAAEGAGQILILNRGSSRAEQLASELGNAGASLRAASSVQELTGERFDLVINATSLGMHAEDPLPFPEECIGIGAALDLVYGPAGTRWVERLRLQEIPAADGLGVLLHQGAAAFERWWGQPAPLEAMRAVLPPRGDHGSRLAAQPS